MKISNFPEFRQTYSWDCGASAAQSVLAYYGIDVQEQKIIKIAKTTKKGTSVPGIKRVFKKYKLDFVAKEMKLPEIKKYIDKKVPVMMLVQAWTQKNNIDWKEEWKEGHYVVAMG